MNQICVGRQELLTCQKFLLNFFVHLPVPWRRSGINKTEDGVITHFVSCRSSPIHRNVKMSRSHSILPPFSEGTQTTPKPMADDLSPMPLKRRVSPRLTKAGGKNTLNMLSRPLVHTRTPQRRWGMNKSDEGIWTHLVSCRSRAIHRNVKMKRARQIVEFPPLPKQTTYFYGAEESHASQAFIAQISQVLQ